MPSGEVMWNASAPIPGWTLPGVKGGIIVYIELSIKDDGHKQQNIKTKQPVRWELGLALFSLKLCFPDEKKRLFPQYPAGASGGLHISTKIQMVMWDYVIFK